MELTLEKRDKHFGETQQGGGEKVGKAQLRGRKTALPCISGVSQYFKKMPARFCSRLCFQRENNLSVPSDGLPTLVVRNCEKKEKQTKRGTKHVKCEFSAAYTESPCHGFNNTRDRLDTLLTRECGVVV